MSDWSSPSTSRHNISALRGKRVTKKSEEKQLSHGETDNEQAKSHPGKVIAAEQVIEEIRAAFEKNAVEKIEISLICPESKPATYASDRLPIELTSSALNFLTRSQLLRLPVISYRLLTMLSKDFTSEPYMFLGKLELSDYRWTINSDDSEILRPIELLAQSKFVRFEFTELTWPCLEIETEYLNGIRHVCKDGELRLKCFDAEIQQQAFMTLMTNCRSLDLLGYHTITWLSDILTNDNLQSVSVYDWYRSDDNPADLPDSCLEAIIGFLFKFTNNEKSRELHIRNALSNQNAQTIVHAIEETFIKTTAPMAFILGWGMSSYSWTPILTAGINQWTNQKLRLYTDADSPPHYVLDVCDL